VAAWLLWTPDKPRKDLERLYLQSPGDMVQVLDTLLHVRDSGPHDAPAVLLVHGFGASLHTWDGWAAPLSQRLRVIRLDLPGSGLSPPDASGDYSDARSMALILALLDQRQVKATHVVGHSIGGRIAWSLAAQHPQQVLRLVLISPDGFASPGFEYGKAPEVPALFQMMRVVLPRWMLRSSLAPAYANPTLLNDVLVTRYHDLMLAPGARAALLARMQQTVLADPLPRLGQIRSPVLLLWGEQDAMIPVAHAQDYLVALPNSRVVRLRGVGHVPQEEAPEEALRAVQDFLLASLAASDEAEPEPSR